MPRRCCYILLVLSGTLWAQEPAPSNSVLERIPASCMGCVVVPDLQQSQAQSDALLAGFRDNFLLRSLLPSDSREIFQDLLSKAQMRVDLDRPLGAALIVPDPQAVGLSLRNWVRWKLAWLTGDWPRRKLQTPLPLVALLPASRVADIWPEVKTRSQDGLEVFEYRGLTLRAARIDAHYLALSPEPKAIEALRGPRTSLAKDLSPAHRQLILGAAVAVHVRMQNLVSPAREVLDTVDASLDQAMLAAPGYFVMQAVMVQKALPFLRERFTQQKAWTAGLGLSRAGLHVEALSSWDPASPTGRALQQYRTPQEPLLEDLGQLDWVLVMGNHDLPSHTQAMGSIFNLYFEMLRTALLMASDESNVRDETLQKIRQLASGLYQRIDRSQVVFGSPDRDSGVYTLAAVLDVDDAESFQGDLGHLTSTFDDLAGQLLSRRPDHRPRVRFVQRPTQVSIDGRELREIAALHPDLEQLEPDARRMLQATLGEDRIRLLCVAADDQTVVLSLGGGVETARRLVRGARSPSPLTERPKVREALGHLPDGLAALTLLDLKSGFELVHANLKKHDPRREKPEIGIRCDIPIALGSKVQEPATVRQVFFVPADLLRDLALLGWTSFLADAP